MDNNNPIQNLIDFFGPVIKKLLEKTQGAVFLIGVVFISIIVFLLFLFRSLFSSP